MARRFGKVSEEEIVAIKVAEHSFRAVRSVV